MRIAIALLIVTLQIASNALADDLQERVDIKRIMIPQYPRLGLLAAVSGTVTAKLKAAPDGSVQEVVVESGPALLRDAARKALLRWQLSSCSEGVGRTCFVAAVLKFELRGRCELPRCLSEVEVVLPSTIIVRSEAPQAIVN